MSSTPAIDVFARTPTGRARYFVIGATGHVGSQVAIGLARAGCDVTALVRRPGATIQDPYEGTIHYKQGDLYDEDSLRRAVKGIDVVISTANGVVPQRNGGDAGRVNRAALALIRICEEAGVRRFVQSSVPVYKGERHVPELYGKRLLEERLKHSSMQTIVIRNPAFMDVFLPFVGFAQVSEKSVHATTRREYGFARFYLNLIGNLAEKYGIMIAPGGAEHGTPMIATRDVAAIMTGAALYEGKDSFILEAGGPEWLTWRQIAQAIAKKTGRRKVHILALPAWLPRLNQILVRPFSRAVANTFALMSFVADFQPPWTPEAARRTFGLPPFMSVSEYLEANYRPGTRKRELCR